MKVIITGATGFIGRNLAEALHHDGLEVIATGQSLKVGKKLEQKGITFVPGDIRYPDQTDNAFSPADCVIHCAGKAGDWGKFTDFHMINFMGTNNVIQSCARHEINKLIFVSTPSIYYTGRDRINILESDPIPKKQFAYGKTKLMAEKNLLELAKKGFKTIILRPRAVYGRYDNTFVPRILAMSEKKAFPLVNNGSALVDITCIDNFIGAIKDCLSAPDDAWNEIYNISNSEPVTVREWFLLILNIFNRPFRPKNIPYPVAGMIAGMMEGLSLLPFGNKMPSMTRFSVGYMARSMTLSIEKAKQKLNYSPQISNKQGFEDYKKWRTEIYTQT